MSISAPAAPPPSASLRIVSGSPRGDCERLYAANIALVGKMLIHFPFLTGEARSSLYPDAD
jgi:hypothetical protein